MRYKAYIFFIPLLILFSSCNTIRFNQALQINENEDWLMCGGNLQKTNISNSKDVLTPPFKLLWEYSLEAGISKNSISASDGAVFINTLNGELQALNITNGKSLGCFNKLGKASYSTPLIYKNYIICTFAGDKQSSILCYDLKAGNEMWRRNLHNIEASPIIVNGNILVSTTEGEVVKLNLLDGKELWDYKIKNLKYGFYNSPTYFENKVCIGSTDGNIYCLDFSNGKELWQYKTNASVYADVSVYNNKIYCGSDDRNFYCLDTAGKLIWSKNFNSKIISSPGFYNDKIILSTVSGYIYSLNETDGNENWKFETKGTIHASPLIKDNKIFIGSFDFYFYCLSAEDGAELWKYKTEGRVRSSAVVWKDYILVGSDPKYFYCFK